MTTDDWKGEHLIRGQKLSHNGRGSNMRYIATKRTKERDQKNNYTPKSPRFAPQKRT